MQPLDEIERWHREKDPWDYESSEYDQLRKEILLSEIPPGKYQNVLDIGCGQGFVTRDLPGDRVFGVDISGEAIRHAKKYEDGRISFQQASIFDLNSIFTCKFDLIVVTGVLYPHYVGNSLSLIYEIVDKLLNSGGVVVSVHINSWYRARFPYLLFREFSYDYREYVHKLEIYSK